MASEEPFITDISETTTPDGRITRHEIYSDGTVQTKEAEGPTFGDWLREGSRPTT